jgi:hypothetical protein
MKKLCAWCGEEVEDDKHVEYTHDDKSVEYACNGECEKEYDNSRGLN